MLDFTDRRAPGTFRSMRAGAAENVADALRTTGERELIPTPIRCRRPKKSVRATQSASSRSTPN